MDLDLFFGRFHPLVVHFPIALLVAAALIEGLSKLTFFKSLTVAQPFLLFLGTLTALMSIVMGWFIAGDRGYDDTTLFWHRWMGVLVFVVSAFLWVVSINLVDIRRTVRVLLFALVFLLVSFTGHLGGSLTHGEDYLAEYAPDFLRNWLSPDSGQHQFTLPDNPDSVIVFKHLIEPILTTDCLPCHNETQQKGGLVLTSVEAIEKGGDNGPAIVAGKSMESELFHRITLPLNNTKFMPVKKEPLSYAEVSLIKWWIDAGASYEARLTDAPLDGIKELLVRDFHYDPSPRPYYEVTKVSAAAPDQLETLRQQGFVIHPLSRENNYLSVSVAPGLSAVTPELLESLRAIGEQVTWLDLTETGIADGHLAVIAGFPNLTRLRIASNPVTDEGIKSLQGLKYLEILNLVDTRVTDASIEVLAAIPALKSVYLWRTDISPSATENLLKLRPALKLDTGFHF